MGRKRAAIFLSESDIRLLLRLPENVHIVACRDDFLRSGIEILITGEELEEVPEGCEAPRIPSTFEYDEVLDVFRINLEM